MQAYPNYKDTNFDWLGKVPSHWELGKLGICFSERNEKVSDTEYPALSVTKNGIVPQMEHVAKTDAGDNRKKVCANDFVINSRSDRKGSAGVSELDGSVSLISIVLKPKYYLPKFAHHLFRSYNFQEEFYRYGKGIVSDLWSTRFAEMKNIVVPLVPKDEQEVIADFLDRETTRINQLIVEKQNFIKLLKEKRQALISHAVTKGLDPNVKMKNSGVEWIGEVPEHWMARPIRYVSNWVSTGGTPKNQSSFSDSEGIPWYTPGDFNGEISLSESKKKLSDNALLNNDARIFPKNCVLVVGIGATLGKVALAQDKFSCNQQINIIFPNKHVNSEFLCLSLSTQTEQMRISSNTSTIGIMNQEKTKSIRVAFPNIDEQIVLVDHIKSLLKQIDNLNSEVLTSIKLLREHRTALISAAVTGKIDVRNAKDATMTDPIPVKKACA